MKKGHSKLSKNEPEKIPYITGHNLLILKGLKRLKLSFERKQQLN